jgi:hypothetical protein
MRTDAQIETSAARPVADLRTRRLRSRITNGSALLPDIDHRSAWMRRFRDLNELHLNDRGGEAAASEAEKALVRRGACLIVELEQMEQRFALNGGGTIKQLECYQRMTNTLRRVLESLGFERRARDVTPRRLDDYLASLQSEPEPEEAE